MVLFIKSVKGITERYLTFTGLRYCVIDFCKTFNNLIGETIIFSYLT